MEFLFNLVYLFLKFSNLKKMVHMMMKLKNVPTFSLFKHQNHTHIRKDHYDEQFEKTMIIIVCRSISSMYNPFWSFFNFTINFQICSHVRRKYKLRVSMRLLPFLFFTFHMTKIFFFRILLMCVLRAHINF